jgi:hypothetical protein
MAQEAVTNAVKDAGISYKDFEQAFVGYVYGKTNSYLSNFVSITDHKIKYSVFEFI